MAARGFDRTNVWIFDLDNTLYPASYKLVDQIERRMNEFIAHMLGVPIEHAQHLRWTYYRQFGTTLTGLMEVHRIDPAPFLDYVHDIDLAAVDPSPELRAGIERLEGRRLIFTNGARRHAERVADKVGIADLFEDICSIETCDYLPKPDPVAFDRMMAAHDVKPAVAAMFEDTHHNLEAPHALGMTTVLVQTEGSDVRRRREIAKWDRPPEHIHHMTDDLVDFLDRLTVG